MKKKCNIIEQVCFVILLKEEKKICSKEAKDNTDIVSEYILWDIQVNDIQKYNLIINE